MLHEAWLPAEKGRVQGINDTLVFSMSSFAAMGSGLLYANIGWKVTNLVSLPFSMLAGGLIVFLMLQRRISLITKHLDKVASMREVHSSFLNLRHHNKNRTRCQIVPTSMLLTENNQYESQASSQPGNNCNQVADGTLTPGNIILSVNLITQSNSPGFHADGLSAATPAVRKI